jgi:hypothetical protein
LAWRWPECGSKHVATCCKDININVNLILINSCLDGSWILICNMLKHNGLSEMKFKNVAFWCVLDKKGQASAQDNNRHT